MSDYVMETGAVLLLAYLLVLVDVLLAWTIYSRGAWLLLVLIPPMIALNYCIVALWQSRPSLRQRD